MANNTTLNAGTGGDVIADEDVAGVKYQLIKLVDSTATSTTRTGVAANPLQVSLANTAANSTAVKVDNSGVTQPVSAASLPLPTGAATAAKQPALGTAGTASSDVITVQGVASMTALKTDGSATTQPISGTVTANGGTNLNTSALALETGGNLATIASAVSAPGSVFNGKTTVTTAGTRVTLAASQAVKSVTVKALAANTGTIYVGNSSVASTNGFQLAAGDTISLDISNLNTVNLDSSVNGEGVTYLGVN